MKGKGQQSTIYDVAKYIIDNFGPMSAMKLQKLAFYSQAMALVFVIALKMYLDMI